MLIVKVYVNTHKVEEIEIGRLDQYVHKDDKYTYGIFYKNKFTGLKLKHKYSDGCFVLMEKALRKFNKYYKFDVDLDQFR